MSNPDYAGLQVLLFFALALATTVNVIDLVFIVDAYLRKNTDGKTDD